MFLTCYFLPFILCNFSVRTLQYIQKKLNLFFAHENIKKRASKVAHNWPRTFFSQVLPGCPNQPRIDFSYYKYVQRFICLLICGLNPQKRLSTYFGAQKNRWFIETIKGFEATGKRVSLLWIESFEILSISRTLTISFEMNCSVTVKSPKETEI